MSKDKTRQERAIAEGVIAGHYTEISAKVIEESQGLDWGMIKIWVDVESKGLT